MYVFAPRIYRSEACIFLRLGRESVGLDPTATTGQTLALQQADRKDEVKSAIEIMKSRSVIGQAVDKLGADVVLGRENHGFSIVGFVTAPLALAVTSHQVHRSNFGTRGSDHPHRTAPLRQCRTRFDRHRRSI